MFSRII